MEATMMQLAHKFGILDLVTATLTNWENWRIHQKSSMVFSRIDSHTLQDIGIRDAKDFTEVCKRTREK